jgi:hypothetical protein
MAWSRIIVMPVYEIPRSDDVSHWHAVWEGEADSRAPLGEFDGPFDAAIAWAKDCRPSELWVYDTGKRDIVPVQQQL